MEEIRYNYIFLTLAPNGDEWLVSCPKHFTPRKDTPTQWTDGWLGHTINVDTVVEKNPCQELNASHLDCSLLTILTQLLNISYMPRTSITEELENI
jgi:hypothetical protein